MISVLFKGLENWRCYRWYQRGSYFDANFLKFFKRLFEVNVMREIWGRSGIDARLMFCAMMIIACA